MYRKLAYFSAVMFSVPLVFILQDKYVGGLFFYGIVSVHGVEYYGSNFFLGTFALSFLILIVGLIFPRCAIWFGDRTRNRVLIIYSLAMCISIVGFLEARYLAKMIYEYEEGVMVTLYKDIHVGSSVRAVQDLAMTRSKHIRYTYSHNHLDRLLNVKEHDSPRFFVDFSYPGLWRLPRVVVETTGYPDQGNVMVMKVFLIKDWKLVAASK